MQKHTGYTFGTIVKVWDDGKGWYSRYQYDVKGQTFQGRQGERYSIQDTVLIIYDTTKPRFSMIAKYPSPITLDSNKNIIALDTKLVNFSWWNYLPGDEIRSIKDLWSL
jgi:hypothetical protein